MKQLRYLSKKKKKKEKERKVKKMHWLDGVVTNQRESCMYASVAESRVAVTQEEEEAATAEAAAMAIADC